MDLAVSEFVASDSEISESNSMLCSVRLELP